MRYFPALSLTRLFFGILALSAVATEIVVLTERGTFTWYNFFSYFTIQSNLAVGVFLIFYAFVGRSKRLDANTAFQLLRGAVTLYIVMTGIIFSVLLSGVPGLVLTAVPWDNIVLHYIMPVVVLIDWLIDPPLVKLRWRQTLIGLAYPILYAVWALARGMIDGWYPYPFLDATKNGYSSVAITVVILTLGVVLATWILTHVRKLPTT